MPYMAIVTARQLAILAELAKEARPGPTYIELAEAVGLKSIGALSYQIRELTLMGLIKRIPRRARTLDLTTYGRATYKRAQREQENSQDGNF